MELFAHPRKVVCSLGVVLVFALMTQIRAHGQTAESLSQVRKVYVGSLGTEEGATELRDAIIKALRRSSEVQIVETAEQADAVIVGSGKIWVTGSMRVGIRGSLSQKTYDGYLQAELVGKNDKTLWLYRVTPSNFQWNGIAWDLASHLVNNLMEAVRQIKQRGAGFGASDTTVLVIYLPSREGS
jgi:hypothetical protein